MGKQRGREVDTDRFERGGRGGDDAYCTGDCTSCTASCEAIPGTAGAGGSPRMSRGRVVDRLAVGASNFSRRRP